jgi:hypothetical protein
MAFITIHLYYIGKPRDPNANRMAGEYIKRTGRYMHCEMREIRPERFDPWARHPAAMKVLLDAAGRDLDSSALRPWSHAPNSKRAISYSSSAERMGCPAIGVPAPTSSSRCPP